MVVHDYHHLPDPGNGTHSYFGQKQTWFLFMIGVLTLCCMKPTGHLRIALGQSGIHARYASWVHTHLDLQSAVINVVFTA